MKKNWKKWNHTIKSLGKFLLNFPIGIQFKIKKNYFLV